MALFMIVLLCQYNKYPPALESKNDKGISRDEGFHMIEADFMLEADVTYFFLN
jgi:hypothetical protein